MTYSQRAKQIFEAEIEELHKLGTTIDSSFDKAIDLIQKCQGKLVVMGIGKTGIIGHKIASSLASTGTPAVFVNAAEAVHGDLGIVNGKDAANKEKIFEKSDEAMYESKKHGKNTYTFYSHK